MPAIVPREAARSPSLAVRDLIDTFANLISRQLSANTAAENSVAFNSLTARSDLQSRQQNNGRQVVQGIIPSYYRTNNPAPGTVAGIVLGSVAGFMLIVWLLFSLTQNGGGAAIAGEEEIVVRRRRSRSPHSRRSRRSSHPEVREYSRSPRSREHVIVEERRGPRPRSRSIIVEERGRVPGDDVVEVIEEHDDYVSRRGSRRSGGSYRY